jgi:transglutaminase-like putative cysteine protease
MQIRVGFEMAYTCPQPTPMLLVLNVHHSRASDLVRPDLVVTTPAVPLTAYRDLFGNWCSRIVAPPGRIVITTEAVVNDSGEPDIVAPRRNEASRASARGAGLFAQWRCYETTNCPMSRGSSSDRSDWLGTSQAVDRERTSSLATSMRSEHEQRGKHNGGSGLPRPPA